MSLIFVSRNQVIDMTSRLATLPQRWINRDDGKESLNG
jgi:hypothetical protein